MGKIPEGDKSGKNLRDETNRFEYLKKSQQTISLTNLLRNLETQFIVPIIYIGWIRISSFWIFFQFQKEHERRTSR